MAACGPPEVTDLGGSGISGDDDDGTIGDDDDDGGTGTQTPTPNGSAAPILTNVPSFATWDAQIRTLGCTQCHSGGSGGFSSNPGDAVNKKYYWFSAICNRNSGGDRAGTQDYSPPTGKFRDRYCGITGATGQTGPHPVGIGNACTAIENWLSQGGDTTPPNCLDYYDLANSS